MTNEQILKKAIEKAVKNGWWGKAGKAFLEGFETGVKKWAFNGRYYSIIFSHDFVKAFWLGKGERGEMAVEIKTNVHGFDCQLAWAFHLQQMVLEKNPLKYLEKFL